MNNSTNLFLKNMTNNVNKHTTDTHTNIMIDDEFDFSLCHGGNYLCLY